MPTYKGNVGNLMQHWTLCELLQIAQQQGVPGLNFIDAHAMAPLARTKDGPDSRFNRAEARVRRDHVPHHQWESRYEWAWHHLAPSIGYPNSAAFVEKVWTGEFSLSLCEVDWPTIAELGSWLDRVRNLERCKNAELFPGDWRDGFDRLLLHPADVRLSPGSLTLVSLDPYRYDPTKDFDDGRNKDGGNLYPDDISRLLRALATSRVPDPIIIQMSTYSHDRGRASQGRVIPQIDVALTTQGFSDGVVVTVPNAQGNGDHQSIMSLVYARGLDDKRIRRLQNLPHFCNGWAWEI